MKYYKNEDGKIYSFDADGSQDDYISDDLTLYVRATDDDGNFYSCYLDVADDDGIYQPDTDASCTACKSTCKSTMKSCCESFYLEGALVTVTVDEVSYTGVFYPDDSCLENAAGISLYRETVDADADVVSMGDYWYTDDENGDSITIPITETLIQKIAIAVKNWQVSCSLAYNETKIAMLALEDVDDFDAEEYMTANLPSRSITVS